MLRLEQPDARPTTIPSISSTPTTPKIAAAELFMYANELAADRTQHPRDDLASELMHGEVDGERLTLAEFNSFFMLLLGRRQRDDAQPDLRRHAGADRAPRGARAPAGRPDAAADRGRGDAALGDAGEPLPAHRDARRRAARPADPRGRQGRPVLRVGQPRRGGLPRRRPLRRRPARRTSTSRSASARTSASAPTWRGSRSA